MKKKWITKKIISITISPKLLEKIDKNAKKNKRSRSGEISWKLIQNLEGITVINRDRSYI